MQDITHTYSFTAVFEDGSVVEFDRKDPNGDKSTTTENGSRFTDVLAKEGETKLVSFVCHNDQQTFGVDLRDGHFEINGIPFFQHRYDSTEPYKDFRIVYYRTVRHTATVGGEIISSEAIHYGVGWQTTFNGKNEQRVMLF